MIRVARCSLAVFDRMDQDCACNHLGSQARLSWEERYG